MRRRRTILAVAVSIAVAVTALAANVAGTGQSGRLGGGEKQAVRQAPSAPRPPQRLELRAQVGGPRRVVARVGAHVTVRVDVPVPGEVDLGGLGLTESATPKAPATFDVLLDRPGDYPVTFRPAAGRSQAAGTLLVRTR